MEIPTSAAGAEPASSLSLIDPPASFQMVPSREIAFEMYESALRPYVKGASFVSAGVWSSPIVVQARADARGSGMSCRSRRPVSQSRHLPLPPARSGRRSCH